MQNANETIMKRRGRISLATSIPCTVHDKAYRPTVCGECKRNAPFGYREPISIDDAPPGSTVYRIVKHPGSDTRRPFVRVEQSGPVKLDLVHPVSR